MERWEIAHPKSWAECEDMGGGHSNTSATAVHIRGGDFFRCGGMINNEVFPQRLTIEARIAREPHSMGSRGPLKGSGGIQGQNPGGSSRDLQHFHCKLLFKFGLF